MDNRELAMALLEQATELLNESSDSDNNSILKDLKDAIKEKDSDKVRKTIQRYNEWVHGLDPERDKAKLANAIACIGILLEMFLYAAGMALMANANSSRGFKCVIQIVAGMGVSFAGTLAFIKSCTTEYKVAEKQIDSVLDKYEKRFAEFEKKIDDYSGKLNEKDFKIIVSGYKKSAKILKNLRATKEWVVEMQKQEYKETTIKERKTALKDAKKAKDKDAVKKEKIKYKVTRKLLAEAAELLRDESVEC